MTDGIQVLGPSPGKSLLQLLFVFVLGGAALIFALMQYAGDVGKISGFVLLILWVISLPFIVGSALSALFNGKLYEKAKLAIRNGEVTPTWIVRSSFCNGILIVDEKHKKLHVNGRVCEFSDVKHIEFYTHKGNNYINVILRNGQNPVNKIMVDDEVSAKQAFERLENSLADTN